MYFPTAGIDVAIWIPPTAAFVVSFFTSMGGVSGAFLLLPFQMSFLGYTSPSVSSTNHVYNIVAIPSGVYRYWRDGRMVWPLTWVVILGTLPGVLVGALVRVAYLPDITNFKAFAAAVLAYIAMRLVVAMQRGQKTVGDGKRREGPRHAGDVVGTAQATAVQAGSLRRLRYTCHGEHYDVSLPGVLAISIVVGVVGGVYGIGGGAIIAPLLVSFFGLPVRTVAGAALMGTFVTSVAGVLAYRSIAPYFPHLSVSPDWLLGMLFGTGGAAGMYLGARCQKYVPETAIKLMLVLILLATALRYLGDFFSH